MDNSQLQSHQESTDEIPGDGQKFSREYLVENVEKIAPIFQGRMDCHAEQQDDGRYIKVEGLTTQDWIDHLKGIKTIGIYLLEDGNVRFAVIDVDEIGADARKFQLDFQEKLAELGIPSYIEPSGKKGSHLWLLFNCLLSAHKVRLLLYYVKNQVIEADSTLKRLDSDNKIEIFPKQSGGVDFGSLIKMPFGWHKVGKKWTEFITCADGTIERFDDLGLKLILDSPMVPEITLDKAIAQIPQSYIEKEQHEVRKSIPQGKGKEALPCFLNMDKATVLEGARDITAFRYCIHLYRQGYSQDTAEALAIAWDENHCSPPLGSKIIRAKVKQAYKGTYGFGCLEPTMRQYCVESCPIYKKRHLQDDGFVPTSQQVEVEIDRITEITSAPPIWEVVIAHRGKEIQLRHLSTEHLETHKVIDRKVFEYLGFHPFKNIKPSTWINYIDTFQERGLLTKEEAPLEASYYGRITNLIYKWLENSPKAETESDYSAGLPVEKKEFCIFKIESVLDILSRRHHLHPSDAIIWDVIRTAGGGGGRKDRKSFKLPDGFGSKNWWLPKRKEEEEEDESEDPTAEDVENSL